jgi:hypothetical protein
MLEEGNWTFRSRLGRRHRFGPMNCRVNCGRNCSFRLRITSVKRKAPSIQCGVAYRSSHLAGAQSELIVLGPRGSFALPQTVPRTPESPSHFTG